MREVRAQEAEVPAVLPVHAVPSQPSNAPMAGEVADRGVPHLPAGVIRGKGPHVEIDLGGEKVTSHAATHRFGRGLSVTPVIGSAPSRTTRKSSASTSPDRPTW